MNQEIASFLLNREEIKSRPKSAKNKLKLGFIDRTLKQSAYFIRTSINQYESSKKISGFQYFSAPALLICFLCWIVCISITHTIRGQLIFFLILLLFNIFSAKSFLKLYRRIFVFSFLFGFLVMAPAAMNVFTPGRMIMTFIRMDSEKTFLIYHIPADIGITYQGLLIVLRMFLKVFNSLSLTFFLLQIVTFDRLIKAFRRIRIPSVFIMILTLSYKFIFILAYTMEEMYMALKARWTGNNTRGETRKIVAGRMGFLFKKSWMRYEETYRAMVARGFTGEVKITGIEKMKLPDIALLILFTGIGILNCIF